MATTISTSQTYDSAARTAGDTYTIQSGATFTIDSDTRDGKNAAAARAGSMGSYTMTAATGGTVLLDGTKVWVIDYDGLRGSPNVIKPGMSAKQALVETVNFVEDPPAASVDIPSIVDGLLNTPDSIQTGKSLGDATRQTLIQLLDMFRRFALDVDIPVVHTETGITAGDIDISITESPEGTFTEQRE